MRIVSYTIFETGRCEIAVELGGCVTPVRRTTYNLNSGFSRRQRPWAWREEPDGKTDSQGFLKHGYGKRVKWWRESQLWEFFELNMADVCVKREAEAFQGKYRTCGLPQILEAHV